MIACLLIMIGCGKDKINYDNSTSDDSNLECGYLLLPGVVSVDISSENFNESSSSRAGEVTTEEASDNYLITITKRDDNTVVYNDTYGEFKSIGELALLPASYNITVNSTLSVPTVDTQAHYAGSDSFTIVSKMTTTLDNLICTMSNIKVSVKYSEELLDLFKEDSENIEENFNVKVTLGDSAVNYSREESGTTYYFKAIEVSNTIELELTGMYNSAAQGAEPNYTMIEGWKQSISGVKAGQWRNISINIDSASEGSANFIVSIETLTHDEELDVDVTDSSYQLNFTESELDDPENYISDDYAPEVTQGSDKLDTDQLFYIDQNSFSEQSTCIKPLVINAEPTNDSTLSEVWIEFTSSNATLNTILESSLGEKRREHILLANEISDNFTSTSNNSFEATYNKMYQLYLYSGTHTAVVMAKDSKGRKSYNSLTIIASNDNGEEPTLTPPTISWRGGDENSFDESHVVDPINGLEVIIDIVSVTGITGFTLEINSDTLTPDELNGINLAQEMDLINPGSCEDGLTFLNFPTGDQVRNQTSMVFDISSFMPMLAGIGSGDSDFVLNVTDAGGTTSKTLHICVE